MRGITFFFTVAFTTFRIGIGISELTTLKPSPQSKTPANTFNYSVPSLNGTKETAVLKQQAHVRDVQLTIRVMINLDPPEFTTRIMKIVKGNPALVDLDLGENFDDQEITLTTGTDSAPYRILQRYRTSMSIQAEGPHVDLVDWRHFDSAWVPLQQFDRRRFRTLATDEMHG